MATKLVCDVCNRPIDATNTKIVRGNGTFSIKSKGVYITGSFRVVVDGKGVEVDVCAKCLTDEIFHDSKNVDVFDGPKPLPSPQ